MLDNAATPGFSEQVRNAPILVAVTVLESDASIQIPGNSLSVRKISPHNQRNLLLPQLLDCNLQRIRLSLKVNEYGRIHTATL